MRWILILTTLLQLAACTNPPWPRGTVEELYPQPLARPELATVKLQAINLNVARTQGEGSTPILFVHGSPGSWTSWARYLDDPQLAGFGRGRRHARPAAPGGIAGRIDTERRSAGGTGRSFARRPADRVDGDRSPREGLWRRDACRLDGARTRAPARSCRLP